MLARTVLGPYRSADLGAAARAAAPKATAARNSVPMLPGSAMPSAYTTSAAAARSRSEASGGRSGSGNTASTSGGVSRVESRCATRSSTG